MATGNATPDHEEAGCAVTEHGEVRHAEEDNDISEQERSELLNKSSTTATDAIDTSTAASSMSASTMASSSTGASTTLAPLRPKKERRCSITEPWRSLTGALLEK
ncbi:hypothetical protein BGX21_006249, partial [Mortierella sp. AD011]